MAEKLNEIFGYYSYTPTALSEQGQMTMARYDARNMPFIAEWIRECQATKGIS